MITVRRHDINLEISVVHRKLRAALLQILQNQDITISRFGNLNYFSITLVATKFQIPQNFMCADGCNYTTTLFDIDFNKTIGQRPTWETQPVCLVHVLSLQVHWQGGCIAIAVAHSLKEQTGRYMMTAIVKPCSQ